MRCGVEVKIVGCGMEDKIGRCGVRLRYFGQKGGFYEV